MSAKLKEAFQAIIERAKDVVGFQTRKEIGERYDTICAMMHTMQDQDLSLDEAKRKWIDEGGQTREGFIEEVMNRGKGPAPAGEDRAALMQERQAERMPPKPEGVSSSGKPKPEDISRGEDISRIDDGYEHERPFRRR